MLVGLAVALQFVWRRVPGVDAMARDGIAHFTRTSGRFAESTSLLGGDDPAFVVVSFLGLLVLPFVPSLLFSTWQTVRSHRPGLLALVAYAWYFLGLSAIQRRFAGEFALFFSLVVGLAVGGVLVRLGTGLVQGDDDGPPDREGPRPDASSTPGLRTLFAVTLVGVVLVSVTVAQVPLTMENRTVSDAEYGATQRIEVYAAERDWNRTNGYVFSPLASNRMYNYYAHGEEVGFGFAKRQYSVFLVARDEQRWYRTLDQQGTGFVVLTDEYRVNSDASLEARLQRNLGSASGTTGGIGQYRLVYRSEDDTVSVYTLVRGALLSGVASPNETVCVTTDVSAPETSFTYVRRPNATASGRYGVLVPYPGTYRVGDRRVRVDERDVLEGRTAGMQGPAGHWTFDEGRGRFLFDRTGQNHAVGRRLNWTEGVRNRAVTVSDESRLRVRGTSGLDPTGGFTLSLWVRTQEGVEYRDAGRYPRLVSAAPSSAYRNTSGYQIGLAAGTVVGAIGNGSDATVLTGPAVDDGDWHHVALTWNGTETRLYVDGRLYGAATTRSTPTRTDRFAFGATTDFQSTFEGSIDEVRFRDEALSPGRIRAEVAAIAPNGTARA
jgi:dolichyl-diphosphooligosaccharide--protein glycosyltransferase